MVERIVVLLISIAVAMPQLGLALSRSGLDPSRTTGAATVCAAAAAALAIVNRRWRPPPRAGGAIIVIALVVTTGAAIGIQFLPAVQVSQGLRILLFPVLGAIAACLITRRGLVTIMRFLSFVVVASFATSVLQQVAGVDSLVQSGLEYGTTVRTAGGVLRASGLALTNYELGSFAGVFAASAWLWWAPQEVKPFWRAWSVFAGASAAGALVTSSYRTGMVVLVLSLAVFIIFRGNGRAGLRILAAVLVGAAIWGLGALGLLSTTSLETRTTVWQGLLQDEFTLLGQGLGSAGAASGSSYSTGRISTDNYFLNLFVQFGVGGAILALILVVWAVRLLARSRKSPRFAGGYVLFSCIVAFWFVEFWEYSSAMILAMVVGTQGFSENPPTPKQSLPSDGRSRLTTGSNWGQI